MWFIEEATRCGFDMLAITNSFKQNLNSVNYSNSQNSPIHFQDKPKFTQNNSAHTFVISVFDFLWKEIYAEIVFVNICCI